MTEVMMLIFTGVIAFATIVYCYFSYQLWRVTRASVDIARYAAFSNLLMQLTTYISDAKAKNLPEATLLEQVTNMAAEFGFDKFLTELDLVNDKSAHLYFGKIEGILRGHNIDPLTIPWFRPIARQLEKK